MSSFEDYLQERFHHNYNLDCHAFGKCCWEASEKATLERVKKMVLELKRDPIADYDDLTLNTIVDMIGLDEDEDGELTEEALTILKQRMNEVKRGNVISGKEMLERFEKKRQSE